MNEPRILLIQPPFVQLNAPYPSPYYLKAFLAGKGLTSRVQDHSIGLFSKLFSKQGLSKIFADAGPEIEARLRSEPQSKKLKGEDLENEEYIRENLFRFLSQAEWWIGLIDRLVNFLRGEDREFGHLISAAHGALPSGPRTDSFLESVEGSPAVDDAGLIASYLLADLADFITVAVDPSFSLVRYAESLAVSVPRFSSVEKAIDGYILSHFYEELLGQCWDDWEAELGPGARAGPDDESPLIVACTIPFPGCLAGALMAAKSAKARFGSRLRTIAGGGYVNTELRSIQATGFFDYFDYLSFDRGYGSLEAILEREGLLPKQQDKGGPLYKTMFKGGANKVGGVLIGGAENQAETGEAERRHAHTDACSVVQVFPDYSDADFSRYIRPIDDTNPMHRLWTDGRWLKAYLAHGCYWHACAFCDVKLDYIRGFAGVDVDDLFKHLLEQAKSTGARGIHLVDEAAPIPALIRLAQLNRDAGLPLVFWGNIRFERGFTSDVAALLAAGGLLGVSAGIEVASERGFKRLGKGLGLKEVVNACAAFKEAGILVHAYLIYGFWDEDDGEIIDSVENMRQLFIAGLVDSAFWHKFVLTRHSRIFAEWEKGRHPLLKVREASDAPEPDDYFANNDLRYEGEERTDRFTLPLDNLISLWMRGEGLESPLQAAFPFKVPKPSIASDKIASMLDEYAISRDLQRSKPLAVQLPGAGSTQNERGRCYFLGSKPILVRQGAPFLCWQWRLETWKLAIEETTTDGAASQERSLKQLLAELSLPEGLGIVETQDRLYAICGEKNAGKTWSLLREGGLVFCEPS